MTYKLVSYEYFMDDLKDWELELLIDNISWSTKNDWEQTRMIMYASLVPHVKKGTIKEASDILPLPTDSNGKFANNNHDYEVSNEQIEILKQRSAHLEKILNNKHNG